MIQNYLFSNNFVIFLYNFLKFYRILPSLHKVLWKQNYSKLMMKVRCCNDTIEN